MVVTSLVGGVLAAILASAIANGEIDSELYGTIAQILPVFLIALAVEQRLVNRLGMTEGEYAVRAGRSVDLAVRAENAYENGENEEGKRIELLLDGEREFRWTQRHAHELIYAQGPNDAPDINLMARTRYRKRRRSEAAFVIISVALLAIGEGAALGGLLQDGTSRCSPLLWMAVGSTVATFLAITLGSARELLSGMATS